MSYRRNRILQTGDTRDSCLLQVYTFDFALDFHIFFIVGKAHVL